MWSVNQNVKFVTEIHLLYLLRLYSLYVYEKYSDKDILILSCGVGGEKELDTFAK